MKIVRILGLFTVLFMMASCSVPQSRSNGSNGIAVGFNEGIVLNKKYAGGWKRWNQYLWFAVQFYEEGGKFKLKEGQGSSKEEALNNLGNPKTATVNEKTGEIILDSTGAPMGWKYYIKDGGRKIEKYIAVYDPSNGHDAYNPLFLYDGTMDLVD